MTAEEYRSILRRFAGQLRHEQNASIQRNELGDGAAAGYGFHIDGIDSDKAAQLSPELAHGGLLDSDDELQLRGLRLVGIRRPRDSDADASPPSSSVDAPYGDRAKGGRGGAKRPRRR
jgi:hypothetical protein